MMEKYVSIEGRKFKRCISALEIEVFVKELATQMNAFYGDKNPIIISVLDGAFMFTADLIRQIDFQHELVFVKLESYVGTETTGKVKTILPLYKDVEDRHVLIIEDIVDTGTTLDQFNTRLYKDNPKDISICSLLLKPDALEYELPIRFTGMKIPNDFIIGYGMDVDGKGRHYKDIYVLQED